MPPSRPESFADLLRSLALKAFPACIKAQGTLAQGWEGGAPAALQHTPALCVAHVIGVGIRKRC